MRPSTDLLLPSPSISLFSALPSAPPSPYSSRLPTTSRRMASSLKPTPVLNISFGHLSSELLALIFERLRDVDSTSLESVRLASRRFDAIATPIVYRFLTLNERLVAPDAEQRYPNALRHIYMHTNHVAVSSDLDPEGITRILLGIQRLASIRWRLQTLHYEDRGQGTSFEFQPGERLPPFTQVLLRSYDWNHSVEDVRMHWDFSQIESLELLSVPVFNFLSSISFGDLSGLHTLHVEDYSHLTDRRQEATGGLYLLIRDHIRALEVLDITCHTEIFPLDAILTHRRSLKVLRFRDHVGFADDDEKCPTLWDGHVKQLSHHLTSVHTLELDMDFGLCDAPEFLRAVCAFPSLHTLALHVQTVVRPFEENPAVVDRDYESAMQTFRFLVQGKHMCAPTSWRRITINVGGWKRVMVRRLGSAWHRQNEMGIYAERCFVLERDVSGRLGVREEMCLENSSRRASPAP
ncbi:hypothetical protein G7Z17_g8291 [Cylindrodendrum hubeiense]|uniref:F-box domain-containing protein n=1 Tax=Cylindrodendrum hubeiense TaxID=595255 RepID=A0A9P5H7C1_9HYPO|nr:hypothetical protein G7Z17_g8291 [Cylindrodendrum hubeiense]